MQNGVIPKAEMQNTSGLQVGTVIIEKLGFNDQALMDGLRAAVPT